MPSIGNVGAVPPQIQSATTGKAYNAQKQEGQAAIKLIEAATETAKATQSSGPKATGNNVDITV